MHFGEMLEEDRYLECIRLAYENGVRTFVTADVYGQGKADAALLLVQYFEGRNASTAVFGPLENIGIQPVPESIPGREAIIAPIHAVTKTPERRTRNSDT